MATRCIEENVKKARNASRSFPGRSETSFNQVCDQYMCVTRSFVWM